MLDNKTYNFYKHLMNNNDKYNKFLMYFFF